MRPRLLELASASGTTTSVMLRLVGWVWSGGVGSHVGVRARGKGGDFCVVGVGQTGKEVCVRAPVCFVHACQFQNVSNG